MAKYWSNNITLPGSQTFVSDASAKQQPRHRRRRRRQRQRRVARAIIPDRKYFCWKLENIILVTWSNLNMNSSWLLVAWAIISFTLPR